MTLGQIKRGKNKINYGWAVSDLCILFEFGLTPKILKKKDKKKTKNKTEK